ncbi:hypothetical protein AB0J80_38365, partial [Actinoplanes sp. NPDC049548]|uniref:hypothetical protein n=1 Tax=Actinoplanes sp. NPDC049548 TaxID=3155152 RepID=UPI003417A422
MTTQVEETVIDADRRHTQHIGENPAQQFLTRRTRRGIPHLNTRRRQSSPIQLTVRRHRQNIKRHERRRHQIIRQQPTHKIPQTRRITDHIRHQ